jgi:menaquinone-9 beta-reductase
MYDVAIIGAGPAGSVAASFLAQARRKVIFFDRAEFPRDKPCGDLVAPEAVDILRQVGAGPRFDQHNFFPIYKARIIPPANGGLSFRLRGRDTYRRARHSMNYCGRTPYAVVLPFVISTLLLPCSKMAE